MGEGEEKGDVFIVDRGPQWGLINEVTYEQRLKRSERVSLVKIWREKIPGRGSSRCKGPKGNACFTRLKRSVWLEQSKVSRRTLKGGEISERKPDHSKTLIKPDSRLNEKPMQHF